MPSNTNEPQRVIHSPKPIHPNTFELREGAISRRHFKLPYTAEIKLTPSPPLPEYHRLPPNLNRPWETPVGERIHDETKGDAVSTRHVKLTHMAKEKPKFPPPPPKHHALPPNLCRLDQSPNDADNTNILRNHNIPSTAGKQIAPVPTLKPTGEARSKMAAIQEQDGQAAEARPRLVVPERRRIEAADRQGGQPYRPPHLRGNAPTGPNRMPTSLPPHIASKNWRRSIDP